MEDKLITGISEGGITAGWKAVPHRLGSHRTVLRTTSMQIKPCWVVSSLLTVVCFCSLLLGPSTLLAREKSKQDCDACEVHFPTDLVTTIAPTKKVSWPDSPRGNGPLTKSELIEQYTNFILYYLGTYGYFPGLYTQADNTRLSINRELKSDIQKQLTNALSNFHDEAKATTGSPSERVAPSLGHETDKNIEWGTSQIPSLNLSPAPKGGSGAGRRMDISSDESVSDSALAKPGDPLAASDRATDMLTLTPRAPQQNPGSRNLSEGVSPWSTGENIVGAADYCICTLDDNCGAEEVGPEDLDSILSENNPILQSLALDVELAHFAVDKTYFIYDPSIDAGISLSKRKPGAPTVEGDVADKGAITFSKNLPSGGSFDLTYGLSRTNTPDLIGKDYEYESTAAAKIVLPLGQGSGRFINSLTRYKNSNALMASLAKYYQAGVDQSRSAANQYNSAVTHVMNMELLQQQADAATAKQISILILTGRSPENWDEKTRQQTFSELNLSSLQAALFNSAARTEAKSYFADIANLQRTLGCRVNLRLKVPHVDSIRDYTSPREIFEALEKCTDQISCAEMDDCCYELQIARAIQANLALDQLGKEDKTKPQLNLQLEGATSNSDKINLDDVFGHFSGDYVAATLQYSTPPGERAAKADANVAQLSVDRMGIYIAYYQTLVQINRDELRTALMTAAGDFADKANIAQTARVAYESSLRNLNLSQLQCETLNRLTQLDAQFKLMNDSDIALVKSFSDLLSAYNDCMLAGGKLCPAFDLGDSSKTLAGPDTLLTVKEKPELEINPTATTIEPPAVPET